MEMRVSQEEQQAILEMRRKKAEEKAKECKVRELESFTSGQKAAIFESLYQEARDCFENVRERGYQGKDAKEYMWEHVMVLMLAVDGDMQAFWAAYNKMVR